MINDAIASRSHCAIELDEKRGGVYVVDYSTNGTYLNGIKLPSSKHGKVLLSHGDELLLKDPATGNQEFGYIVNLTETAVKEEVQFLAPQRLTSDHEKARMHSGTGMF